MATLRKFMQQLFSDGLKTIAGTVACLRIIFISAMMKYHVISSVVLSVLSDESSEHDAVGFMKGRRYIGVALLLLLMLLPFSVQAIIISSTSVVSSSTGSYTVTVKVDAAINTAASMGFYRYANSTSASVINEYVTASLCDAGAGFTTMSDPTTFSGNPINLPDSLELLESSVFKSGETLFIRIDDFDKNADDTVIDTVDVTLNVADSGDSEIVRLTETGINTGVFTGYIKLTLAATATDCQLSVRANSQITANYLDNVDGTGPVLANILVDPFGLVFSSSDGAPLDGIQVSMIDVGTGMPATVFGDDGVSSYPSTVITGADVTDGNGNLYTYPPGNYRFPFVAPGNYRLEVVAPANYTMPSVVTDTELQLLPGAPYSLVLGSRGENFAVLAGPALNIDIPIDPPTLILYVAKRAAKPRASVGDFIPYSVQLSNNSVAAVADVTLTDVLPVGLRYQAGSIKVDNVTASEPVISADGRTLQFTFPQLSALSSVDIQYVAKVGVNAKMGDAKNTAVAISSNGLTSNVATATVDIWDDLMRSKSQIAGRVFLNSCGYEDALDIKNDIKDVTKADSKADVKAKAQGAAGIRLLMEDGRFVDTDKKGLYHFNAVTPGTHVVQLDLDSIPEQMEVVACGDNSRFAGTAHSQFVDVKGGLLWRADFYLRKKPVPISNAAVAIQVQSTLDKIRGEVRYKVIIQGNELIADNRQVRIDLPLDLVVVSGSATLDGVAISDPETSHGTLRFNLGSSVKQDWRQKLRFLTQINNVTGEELLSRASMRFDTKLNGSQQSAEVENLLQYSIYGSDRVVYRTMYSGHGLDIALPELRRLNTVIRFLKNRSIRHIRIAAYTDNLGISGVLRQTFQENSQLSLIRARQFRDLLLDGLDINPEIIKITGLNDKGTILDAVPSKNTGPNGEGVAGENNRHVAIYVQLSEKDESKMVDKGASDSGMLVKKLKDALTDLSGRNSAENKDAAEAQNKKQGILSIKEGQLVSTTVKAIRVRLDSRLVPNLLFDQQEISADRIGFTAVDKESGTTLYSYIGVNMGQPGTHYLSLQGKGPFGNIRYSQQIEFIQTGEIADIRVVSTDGNIADGKTPVKMTLQLLDKNGDVIRSNVNLTYKGGDLKRHDIDKTLPLSKRDTELVKMNTDGVVTFSPVTSSGSYTVNLEYNDIAVRANVYVKPHYRDWIMVGLLEGTVGYRTISGNQQNLDAADKGDEFYQDGRVSFYAKGKILGKYLLTAAYDSKKQSNNGATGLFGNVDPDKYYTLYGDGADVRHDAASSKKLYIKLESDDYYAMYGDFDTGLSVTELSKYNRRMTGLKGEYKGNKITVKGFAADTNHAFIKDEILGDGTSGLYYLSRQDIVINSGKITIETRDRFHSEKILKTQTLNQFVDYNLDPEEGTIFFKSPVFRHDGEFNPVYIVAEYEVQNDSQQAIVAGARASIALAQADSEAGVSIISDSTPGQEAGLAGVDVKYQLSKSTRVKAEYATTTKTNAGVKSNGDAYLVEMIQKKDSVSSKLYMRQQQGDFSLGQQNDSESGTRKIGADFAIKLTEQVTGNVELSQQKNLTSESTRQVVDLSSVYKSDNYSVSAGIQHAQDKDKDGKKQQSDLLAAGMKRSFLDKKVNLNVDVMTELSISENTNSDYPSRIMVGGDYQITENSSVFLNQEHTIGDLQDSDTTRIGVKTKPWNDAVFSSSVEQQRNESGIRTFASSGLTQRVQLTENLLFDAGIDRTETIRHPGATPINANVPLSSGTVSEDFTALSSGMTYTQDLWSMTSRAEYRNGEQYDKFGLLIGLYHESSPAFGMSYSLRHFDTKRNAGNDSKITSLSYSVAYRPLTDPWMLLNKLLLTNESETIAALETKTTKIINNVTANYLLDSTNQIAFHHGIKHVNDNISGSQYSGLTQLLDLEYRHDINRRWDVGVQGGVLHSEASGNYSDSFGVSVGASLMKNLWVSLGYNFSGFEDNDFSAAGYTAQGVYMKFRFSLDHLVARRAMAWWEKRAKPSINSSK